MKIHLTPEARKKLQEELQAGCYMKIDLTPVGCCSRAFTIMASVKKTNDIIVDAEGLFLAVSEEAGKILKSITIDYKRRGIRKAFQVQPK